MTTALQPFDDVAIGVAGLVIASAYDAPTDVITDEQRAEIVAALGGLPWAVWVTVAESDDTDAVEIARLQGYRVVRHIGPEYTAPDRACADYRLFRSESAAAAYALDLCWDLADDWDGMYWTYAPAEVMVRDDARLAAAAGLTYAEAATAFREGPDVARSAWSTLAALRGRSAAAVAADDGWA